MQQNICTKYTKIDNGYIGTYHNAMSPKVQKPNACKSCMYYTSRNCNTDFQDKVLSDHNYFG